MLMRHGRLTEARPHIAAAADLYDRNLGAEHQRTRYAVRTLQRIDDALHSRDQ
jgi:hypothetical protein